MSTDTMKRFVEATEPVLREMLKGTGVRATYRRTAEGGEVQLTLDFFSSVSFSEDHVRPDFAAEKADEVRHLILAHLDVLNDASNGDNRFAPSDVHIEKPGWR